MTMPALPNAELAVMELLWRKDRLTGRQIIDRLYADAPKPQHGTVQRLLQRLAAKGFVVRDRSLGISVFSPAISRDAYASAQLESLANRLTQGSLVPMITRLVADNKLSQDEIENLHRILDEEI
ncbi:MAG: BlaI/MecI/CopY family transcriptional regulator [Gemmatimonadetes bacterium]|nr:BlaI/MecI/CopY family transcriptional regulator [Gemmatimonadota bacterium]MDE2676394.1 BlaI/MecI/CopY family transcriptional regulator [Gemmatimonadota bacterium]MXX35617.1 BlaI/MecI/CopY family transcriptional regulator [Gemmatimonadota bacterium]MYE68922.1 BlaI/MecI/CopY family transcriptional regulator [Gemmatimonadota bacterium]MYI65451.1 BlaI/MecI/CopY family transcriptional regulator [Gemmatimonadota bacterium]